MTITSERAAYTVAFGCTLELEAAKELEKEDVAISFLGVQEISPHVPYS